MVSLATIRSKFFEIVSMPFFKDASLISISCTLNPLCAKVWAIPFPIVPAPITAMFFINLFCHSHEGGNLFYLLNINFYHHGSFPLGRLGWAFFKTDQ